MSVGIIIVAVSVVLLLGSLLIGLLGEAAVRRDRRHD